MTVDEVSPISDNELEFVTECMKRDEGVLNSTVSSIYMKTTVKRMMIAESRVRELEKVLESIGKECIRAYYNGDNVTYSNMSSLRALLYDEEIPE